VSIQQDTLILERSSWVLPAPEALERMARDELLAFILPLLAEIEDANRPAKRQALLQFRRDASRRRRPPKRVAAAEGLAEDRPVVAVEEGALGDGAGCHSPFLR
jgi:hypothetical protein